MKKQQGKPRLTENAKDATHPAARLLSMRTPPHPAAGLQCNRMNRMRDKKMRGKKMVRPERFELPTFWFVARRSIQLS